MSLESLENDERARRNSFHGRDEGKAQVSKGISLYFHLLPGLGLWGVGGSHCGAQTSQVRVSVGVVGARESRARVRTLKVRTGAKGDESNGLQNKEGGLRHRRPRLILGVGEPGTGKW